MTEVKSSFIAAYDYDSTSQIMKIQFRDGAEWEYSKVWDRTVAEFLESSSKGIYFQTKIKDKHPAMCIFKPGQRPSKRSDKVMVATPVYLALVKCKKLMDTYQSTNLLYMLWAACGKPAKGDEQTIAGRLFKSSKDVIAEAGSGVIGLVFLPEAIKLAADKKI